MLKKYLKSKLRPEQRAYIKESLRAWRHSCRHSWLKAIRRSEFLCQFHTLFVSQDMSLEARAIVSGQLENLRNRDNAEKVNYFLRRGVHRLEKGLIMPERRPVFGLDYIEDVVRTYAEAVSAKGDPSELAWAHDVLTEYFHVVEHHPAVAKARDVFKTAAAIDEVTIGHTSPYLQDRTELLPISPGDFLKLAQRRRSVRFYECKPVPRTLLDRAIEMAALSPSACNRQPFEFRIFDDIERTEKVSSLAGGTAGFSHQIPCLVVVVGRLRAYVHSRDRHAIYVDGGLAAMSLMYAFETLGLASCPINWPDVRSREIAMAEELGLHGDERVVMLISVGYPRSDVKVAASKKVSLEVLRTYADLESRADGPES